MLTLFGKSNYSLGGGGLYECISEGNWLSSEKFRRYFLFNLTLYTAHYSSVYERSATLFAAVNYETLCCCCSISATCWQKVNLHLIQPVCCFCPKIGQDGAALFGCRPGRSAKIVLLFTFLLTFAFSFYTQRLHWSPTTKEHFWTLDIPSLTCFRTPYPRIHPGHPRFFETRTGTMTTGDGTRNTVEKALEFATDWGKGLTVLLYRAFCSLMSNPWRIRWTILKPG